MAYRKKKQRTKQAQSKMEINESVHTLEASVDQWSFLFPPEITCQ